MSNRSSRRSGRVAGFLLAVSAAIAAVLLAAAPVSAHDADDDTATLVVSNGRISGMASVRFTEIGLVDTSGNGLLEATERADQEAELASTLVDTVRDHLQLAIDGQVVEIVGAGVAPPDAEHAGDEATSMVTLVFTTEPHAGDVHDVALTWAFDWSPSEVVLTHADGVTTSGLGDDGTVDFSLAASSRSIGIARAAVVLLAVAGLWAFRKQLPTPSASRSAPPSPA